MIREMHLLMVGDTGSGDLFVSAKRANVDESKGLRIYFPGGPRTRVDLIHYWVDLLERKPLSWVVPTPDKWSIDVEQAKHQFSEEVGPIYPYEKAGRWPAWLAGQITIAPEFESGEGFAPRLSFLLTEHVIARARSDVQDLGSGHRVVVQQFFKEVRMDQYNVSGQAGAIGPNSTASNNVFNQVWQQAAAGINIGALATELSSLRASMRNEAVDIEHDQAVASVAAAEAAAKRGEGSAALQHLKAAGQWALDVATKIGTSVAAKAIGEALKL